MKRHHLRPFGFFLGYLMHLYTILNIKVVYFFHIFYRDRIPQALYRSYNIIIQKLHKCSENHTSITRGSLVTGKTKSSNTIFLLI
jgi:hypothetical protein